MWDVQPFDFFRPHLLKNICLKCPTSEEKNCMYMHCIHNNNTCEAKNFFLLFFNRMAFTIIHQMSQNIKTRYCRCNLASYIFCISS